jgi:hypothetical protein
MAFQTTKYCSAAEMVSFVDTMVEISTRRLDELRFKENVQDLFDWWSGKLYAYKSMALLLHQQTDKLLSTTTSFISKKQNRRSSSRKSHEPTKILGSSGSVFGRLTKSI